MEDRQKVRLAAFIAVAIAFAVVLLAGFWIQPKSGVILGLAIPVIAITIFCLILGISPRKYLRRFRFRAAPVREPVRHGPSPAQIAYSENRNATATCIHLQPIERAMRMAGLDVQLLEISPHAPTVKATCRINEPAFQRMFAPPAWIYYSEGYQPERSEHDNPRADITCGECLRSDRARSDILVLHPDESRENTPWFPSPP